MFIPKAEEMDDIMDIMGARHEEEVNNGLDSAPSGPEGVEKRRKVRTRAGRKIQAQRLQEVLKEIGQSMRA